MVVLISDPMYYQTLGITAVSAIYRLTSPVFAQPMKVYPSRVGIFLIWEPIHKFRTGHALTWRRAAAAVGIVMQRIGVLGGSRTDCPDRACVLLSNCKSHIIGAGLLARAYPIHCRMLHLT